MHRLPWLLGGWWAHWSQRSSWVRSGNSSRNRSDRLLVPGVVYIAAAVGMQTETLAIRGLSLGVGIRRVAVRELLTGGLRGWPWEP